MDFTNFARNNRSFSAASKSSLATSAMVTTSKTLTPRAHSRRYRPDLPCDSLCARLLLPRGRRASFAPRTRAPPEIPRPRAGPGRAGVGTRGRGGGWARGYGSGPRATRWNGRRRLDPGVEERGMENAAAKRPETGLHRHPSHPSRAPSDLGSTTSDVSRW